MRGSVMHEFVVDAKRLTKAKDHFREVIHTTGQTQVGVMTVGPLQEFSEEPTDSDLVLFVMKGSGSLTMEDSEYDLDEHVLAVIPAGKGYALHNTGKKPLRMVTVSAPPMLSGRRTSAGRTAATKAAKK
jgi:mannose-6-phosphate isomerase-like protein (cupin superfamily)